MARSFNGSSDKIVLPVTSVLRPSLPVSVHAWVRPGSLAIGGIFTTNKSDANHRGFWLLESDTSGHIEAGYGNNVGSTGAQRRSKITSGANALTTGAWQPVGCAIRGATDMDVYLNGADAGGAYSGSGGTMAYNVVVPGNIGALGSASFFNGVIGEVALWTVSLTAAEFAALAKGVSPHKVHPGSLLGYWPVWGVADPEVDLSGNVNNGSVTGAALANHSPVGQLV